ncbi:Zinc finger protein, partial [Geosmithia morbida]
DLILYLEHVETTLTAENSRLIKEIEDTRLDLSDAVKSRRELQKTVDMYAKDIERINENHTLFKNRNPYITVLIDGDGLIFQDQYVRQGVEGGKRAAYALRAAVADQCGIMAQDMEISAKIIANLGGLSKAMVRDGVIDSVTDLRGFSQGFSQAMASFDFIDVGWGKERADTKIKGVSHDSGYAPFLDEILRDETTRLRVTVIQGVPAARALIETGVNVFEIGSDLFRREKLFERTSTTATDDNNNAAVAPAATATSLTITTPLGSTPSEAPKLPGVSQAQAQASAARVPSPLPGVDTTKASSRAASPPPRLTVALPPRQQQAGRQKAQQQQQQPKWNPGPRGLDRPIDVNPVVVEAIKKRKEKLCKNHFLRPPCVSGSECVFVHKYNATDEELDAIAVLTRLNPCSFLQDCDADDCIYGHHCPSMKNLTCTHPHCRFPVDSHPPGTKFKNPYIKQN